jgi:RNA 2',3'-cyclic 3'-phosphodiesterase
MASRTRTFVAVPLPADRASRLAKLQIQLAPSLPGTRWVSSGQLHTTLAFLGDVEDSDLDRVCRAVTEAAARFPPIELRLEGLGVFPNPARPRVVWVALTGPGADTLCDLQKAVTEALAQEGFPSSGERYTPHMTLARFKDRHGRGRRDRPPPIDEILRQYQAWSGGAFQVAEVVTFASLLGPEGPSYNPLSRAALGRAMGEG